MSDIKPQLDQVNIVVRDMSAAVEFYRLRVILSFRVPTRADVDAINARVTAAGHVGQQSPYNAFWGARYAIVQGPDGAIVGLMSPSDEEMRTPPPDPGAFGH